MKILVTGAAGMLSAEVIPELKKRNYKVIGIDIFQRLPDIQKLDIVSFSEVVELIEKKKPDFIFHLAAETNVDLCEKDPDHAFKVNTLGTENIALACQRFDIPLLYISTGGVFPGDKATAYDEFDVPNPANVYGKSKLEGESIIKNLLTKYFIVRAGWMVGGWEIDKKFVFKIIQQIKDGKKELRAVSDKFGCPTFTKDFAKNLLPLLDTERYGLYHMANKGECSRFDIAEKIVEYMGCQDTVKVMPVNSAEFPLPAPRARSERIYNYRLEMLGLNNMPHWEDSLREYIELNKDR